MKPKYKIPQLTNENIMRFWSRVNVCKPDECWTSKIVTNTGYGDFSIRGVHYSMHRISYFLHYGVDPADKLVCHKCDNPACCNPNHLFLGDYKINKQDCVNKNRHFHKFTVDDVRNIDSLLADGYTIQSIGDKFGVCRGTIQAVKERRAWKYVNQELKPSRIFGRDRSGIKNGQAKLTPEQVIEIRQLLSNGATNNDLSIRFNVSSAAISKIRTMRTWRNLS